MTQNLTTHDIESVASVAGTVADAVADAVPKFTRNDDYTTFSAEHALEGEDIVFHFFPTDETKSFPPKIDYWDSIFPDVMSTTTQEFFRADYPRLKAAPVNEFGIKSMWLRCHGFALDGVVEERVKLFYKKLDQALDFALKELTSKTSTLLPSYALNLFILSLFSARKATE